MSIGCVFIIIVCFSNFCKSDDNFHMEKDVDSITLSVIKTLDVHHGILVKNEENHNSNWSNLKVFSLNFIPILYFNIEELLSYFKRDISINVKTIIIFNEKNISNIKNFLQLLEDFDMLYKASRFSWLIFVEEHEEVEKYKELLVPYNCELIIVYTENKIKYKIFEVYKIKNLTIVSDFGDWNQNTGLMVTNIPMCRRRMNFNNEKLILNSYLPENNCNSRRVCVHVEFIGDFANALNFRYDWVSTPGSASRGIINHEITPKNSDILQVIYPFEPDFNVFKCDVVGPVFKSDVNWHIQEPSSAKNPDYYIDPLELDSWIAILLLIFLGVIAIIIQRISRNRLLNEGDQLTFNHIDGIFMPLETFCNQEGSENMPFKAISFAFRFTSMFIWAIYGATITSFLMYQIPKIPFTNLEGFVENGQYLMGFNVKAGKLPQILLEYSRVPLIKHVNQHFIKKSKPSREVNEICNEKLALMSIDYDIYKNKINCKVITIKNPILLSFTIIPLKKNSPFTKVFNYILMNFYTAGLIQRIEAIDFDMTYKPDAEDEFKPVEMDQMVQVLSIVPIGLIFAMIAFAGKVFCKVYSKKFRSKI